MKFVGLISGGKDSFYSIMECIRNGHELLACAHLSPRKQNSEEDEESYMYQTAASECIPTLVEECLGVPLVIRECIGRSKNTSLVYDHGSEAKDAAVEDEVEDLRELLADVRKKFPSVQGISSGAILSTYQRTRIESVCSRLGLTSLGYMWRMGPQRDLLECMLKDGIEAVLVKVASPPGLMPKKHLNKTLGTLHYGGVFDQLKERFDFHICGEGGEYETLVLDCPIFKKKLVLTNVEIIENDDGVGVLKVNECCAVEKDGDTSPVWQKSGSLLNERVRSSSEDQSEADAITVSNEIVDNVATQMPNISFLPKIRVLPGGLAHISELVSQRIPLAEDLPSQDLDIEAELAVLEAKSIFDNLAQRLNSIPWTDGCDENLTAGSATAKDVVFVHLYLANISHFAKINKHYSAFFGTVLPPSRSCVAVGNNVLEGGRRVMMDCLIQRGSGEYMRILPDVPLELQTLSEGNKTFIQDCHKNHRSKLRSTLHVQTISHWAPVCVGPYSQANTLRSGVIFMAGQIGLNPGAMKLVDGGWTNQLSQSWKNAASVLDALEGTLKDAIGAVVYVAADAVVENNGNDQQPSVRNQVWNVAEKISLKSLQSNGGIPAGHVDGLKTSQGNDKYGGFEDYETYKAVMGSESVELEKDAKDNQAQTIPVLMVALPQMPVGATSEVELVCASSKASACLDMNTYCSWKDNDKKKYNTQSSKHACSDIAINSVVRSIGKGCAAIICTTASYPANPSSGNSLDIHTVLLDMIDSASSAMGVSSGLGKSDTLHIRLFYTCSAGDDAAPVRSALSAIVGAEWRSRSNRGDEHHIPATSIVPVKSMCVSPSSSNDLPFMAMQITVVDLMHMETEMSREVSS